MKKWHGCQGIGRPGGNRFVGESVTVRELPLVGAFPNSRLLTQDDQPWRVLFLVPGRKLTWVSPSGGFSSCLGGEGVARGERGFSDSFTTRLSLNNDTLFLWQSGFTPQAFLVAYFLTPIHSGCLLMANISPPRGFTLQTTFQHPAPMCTVASMSQSGLFTAVAQIVCIGVSLSSLPQNGCFTLL